MANVMSGEKYDRMKRERDEVQGELAQERDRSNRLNARNGRLEHEISFLKPESAAKAAMETAYADGMRERDEALAENERLRASIRAHCGRPSCNLCDTITAKPTGDVFTEVPIDTGEITWLPPEPDETGEI